MTTGVALLALVAAAAAQVDECTLTSVCTAEEQACFDPDQNTPDDWKCLCEGPLVGEQTMGPATCTYNECDLTCDTCENNVCADAGQDCVDPAAEFTSTNDWSCVCRSPFTGSQLTAPATCRMDECTDGGLSATCGAEGQACQDPDTAVLGDAKCKCQPPSTDENVGAPVGQCTHNECLDYSNNCAVGGQECFDPDTTKQGDWVCRCVSPQSGPDGLQMLGTCTNPDADCDMYGSVCSAAGQTCYDREAPEDGLYECRCAPPATGTPGENEAATCVFDECVERCITCAYDEVTVMDNVCTARDQLCIDTNTAPNSLANWVCRCKAPFTGETAMSPVSSCKLNECETVCDTCADKGDGKGNICYTGTPPQTCVENSLTLTNDWACQCVQPYSGKRFAGLATCQANECMQYEQVCIDAGQQCVDPNFNVGLDWTCQCQSPSADKAVGKAVEVCTIDECKDMTTCSDVGQNCVDPDLTILGDWRCQCPAPATGSRIQGPVNECALDECTVECSHCANADGMGNICERNAQTCEDVMPNMMSINDWTCTCTTGSGSSIASPVAVCREGVDECQELSSAVESCTHVARYTQEGCQCSCNWVLECAGNMCPPQQGPGSSYDEPCLTGCCNPDNEITDWCFLADSEYNRNKGGCGPGGWGYCIPFGTTPGDGGVQLRESIPGIPDGENNVCTFAQPPQRCVDPDIYSTEDWWCECIPPLTGPKGMQRNTTCTFDECTVHGSVCLDAGQSCSDPDTSGDSTDDWICSCTVGDSSAVAMPASCELDECTNECDACAMSNGVNVCENVGQTCEDNNIQLVSSGDWFCKCVAPSVGQAKTATATCILDECESMCMSCENGLCGTKDQTCQDDVATEASVSDWHCICPSPWTGEGVAALAACYYDECSNAPCPMDQTCIEPDRTTMDNWECHCRQPFTGFAQLAAAACRLNECSIHISVCTNAGQMCIDADDMAVDDWVCRCVAPDMGVDAVMMAASCATACELMPCPAGQRCLSSGACACIEPSTPVAGSDPLTCELDECTVVCPTCERYSDTAPYFCEIQLQDCVDPDPTVLSNWECRCRSPAMGTAGVGAAATCTLNECSGDAGSTCAAAGQTCSDPTDDPALTGDWMCVCPSPSTQTHTGGVVAQCTHDECTDAAKAGMCTDAQPAQQCVDPDPAVLDDWECRCSEPAVGSATGGPATACDTWNECSVTCDACADSGAGNVCTAEEQACVDPDPTVVGDWACSCSVGVGMRVGGPVPAADCVLDECTQVCQTCADMGGGGNMCELEGQACEDTATAADSLSDWRCVCPEPFQTKSMVAGLATCSLDECTEMVNGAVPGELCAQEEQVCFDPHPASLSDWTCSCIAPSTGQRTASLAMCSLNECKIAANNETCTSQMPPQTCMDPNVTNDGDWRCVCEPPGMGSAAGVAAECAVDECAGANGQNCASASPPQQCTDEDMSTSGTWECVCPMPSTGRATMSKANCVLNECLGTCATCSLETCVSAEQECFDPNPSASSTSDWYCKCPSADGSGAEAIGKAATCLVDECVMQGSTCTDAGQRCVDNDQSPSTTGNWECRCLAPATGYAIAFAANCQIDECASYAQTCTRMGQTCVDPNKADSSLNDWECHCVFPATGTAVAEAATCNTDGECGDPLVVEVCNTAGQSCIDPDPATEGDWRCTCIPPSSGAAATGGAAECVLDECTITCPTCSNGVCTQNSQLCIDTDKDPVSGLSSWECRCVEPEYGSKVNGIATCSLNECDVHGSSCTAAEQDCFDPDNQVADDWKCTCFAPSVGEATGGVAMCTQDECLSLGKVCQDAGQTCVDPSKAAADTNDWYCECPPPSTGVTIMGAATCETDECALYGEICTLEGQTCNDTDTQSQGGWLCVCPEPHADITAEGMAAVCMIDECADAVPGSAVMEQGGATVCDDAGQTCVDPDTAPNARWNWKCVCADGMISAVSSVATCKVDECSRAEVLSLCVAADQGCMDPDYAVEGDYMCLCLFPAVGSATGGVAECEVDECTLNGQVCADAAQTCVDTDLTTEGTWECHCPADLMIDTVGRQMPADCTPPSVSECNDDSVRKVCDDAGQLCIDTDFNTMDTWECRCVEPAYGVPGTMAPTMCTLDECEETCLSCGGSVCTSAEQVCEDPNTSADARNDWQCVCEAPTTGTGKLKPARCALDECTATCTTCADTGDGSVCAEAGQTCIDEDTDARALNNWLCACMPPATGMVSMAPAQCILNECAQNPEACPVGQVCKDADVSATSRDDWVCTCIPPQVGSAVFGAATCVLNECEGDDPARTCSAAGQACVDPDPSPEAVDDWECHCMVGTATATMGAAVCELDECADVCPTCADKGSGNVCTQAEQSCQDPTRDPQATGDWMCICPEGTSAVGAVAMCELDECSQLSNFGAHTCVHTPRYTREGCKCACGWKASSADFPDAFGPGVDTACNAGCCNPNLDANGDWCMVDMSDPENQGRAECQALTIGTCVPPADNSGAGANLCSDVGQACLDTNYAASSTMDWQCVCVEPAVGLTMTAGVASCKTDECLIHGNVCAAGGQLCTDASEAENDWACSCPMGAVGEKVVMGAATCKFLGECEQNAFVCEQAGQTCFDPDYSMNGDWVCSCVAPSVGVSAQMTPAICTLDECVADCDTCAGFTCQTAGQLCEDLSAAPTDLEDWVCKCTGGAVGSRQGGVATCAVDECLADGKKLQQLCAQAEQECVDTDPKVEGNWMCRCVAPQSGSATGGTASCRVNECLLNDNAKVCTDAGQACEDLNTDVLSSGDWACKCLDAARVYQTNIRGPAECPVEPDAWCAINGDKCRVAGQECVPAEDPADVAECGCLPPLYGTPVVGGPALCFLDECSAQCPTCADSGAGNICTQNEQSCIEGSQNPVTGLRDWKCMCDLGGSTALAAVAECRVNECTLGGKLCVAGEQTCTDPNTDPAVLDDWYCSCPPPTTGRMVGGLAECTFDECIIHGSKCSIAGQVCRDVSIAVADANDWVCVCIGDGVGNKTGGAATCNYDGECGEEDPQDVCGGVGQRCHDPDRDVEGDWECHCVAPQFGEPGQQNAARCMMDECKSTCPSCAQLPGEATHACFTHNQACEDPDVSIGSTGDWRCTCVAPEYGSATRKTADCHTDECEAVENGGLCEEAGQLCIDRDANVIGDWECACVPPYYGTSQAGRLAVCELDECTAPANWEGAAVPGKNGDDVCTEALQTCKDPNPGKLGDWWCACPHNEMVATTAPVGDCKYDPMLCAQFGDVCREAGQLCVEDESDWLCECVAPRRGMWVAGAAKCTLDECTAACETCALRGGSNVCSDAGQRCVDDNTAAESLNDWRCTCIEGRGSRLGGVAMCEINECAVNSGICEAAKQTCVDTNLNANSKNDWQCVCVPPSVGAEEGGAASCTRDECIEHGSVCTENGQECFDQNHSPVSLGDWLCSCPPPASGTMVGQAARCKYTGGCNDEGNALICQLAGQKCIPGDDTSDPDDFRCACVAPAIGDASQQSPALCVVDECTEVCPTCAQRAQTDVNACTRAQQLCTDVDTSELSNWMCKCPPPSMGENMGAPVESCDLDECSMLPKDGLVSPRQCGHFRRFTVSGCECQCGWQLPGSGGAGHQLPCTAGCCNPDLSPSGDWCIVDGNSEFNKNNPKCQPNARQVCASPEAELPAGALQVYTDVCAEAGQKCVDPMMSHTSVNDWQCMCLYSAGRQTLRPSDDCVIDECAENEAICNEAGQECIDRDDTAASLNDWTCLCVGGGTGYATAEPAVCDFPPLDECREHALTCGPSQYCMDPDTDKDDDWECHCSPPYSGAPTRGYRASCVLDECTATCKHCANRKESGEVVRVCHGAGQSCRDPNMIDQVNDWVCTCVPPAYAFDECEIADNARICSEADQECFDHNTSPSSSNDWTCLCIAPMKGSGVTRVATCTMDDCIVEENLRECEDAGQRCFDPDQSVDVRDDWVCKCATGGKELAPGIGMPAQCLFAGECNDPTVSDVCKGAHQSCIDPDFNTQGDWQCVCVPPMTGEPAIGRAALCGIDECSAACITCANGICEEHDQQCEDFSLSELSDWVCMCQVAQGSSPGLQQPANCNNKVCSDVDDKLVCNARLECMWVDADLVCIPKVPATPAPPRAVITAEPVGADNSTNTTMIAGAGEGDEEDCDFISCWLWLILLLLCCSCILLLLLLKMRKHQSAKDQDEQKWNKKFEAEVEETDMKMMEADGEGDDARLLDREPSKGPAEDPAAESLLTETPQDRPLGGRRESSYTPPTIGLTPTDTEAAPTRSPAPMALERKDSQESRPNPIVGDADDL